MFRTGSLLFACLALSVSGSLTGCAASAIDQADQLANEAPATDDAGEDPNTDGTDSGDDSTTTRDAGTRDATVANRDASTNRDAAVVDSGAAKDASTPKDAAVVDSGGPKDSGQVVVDSGGPKDSGQAVVDSGGPTTQDAGGPANGQCSQDSDCTNLCAFTGIFSCCMSNKTCGCTYAPGAFCI